MSGRSDINSIDMETFLMVIFWIILGFYLLGLAFRYLFPWLLGRFVNRMARKMQEQSQSYQQSTTQQSDINISPNSKSTKLDPDIGEYIDFEEIKDPKQQ